MGEELGVTEATVRKRTARLVDDAEIAIVALPRIADSDLIMSADIGLYVRGDQRSVAERIAGRREVTWAALTTGVTPIRLSVSCRGRNAMVNLLDEVASMEGVEGLVSSPWLRVVKNTAVLYPGQGTGNGAVARSSDPIDESWLAEILDPIDAGVIRCLVDDARCSYKAIAESVGVAEATARKRTLRLLESGMVQATAILSPNKMELGFRGGAAMRIAGSSRSLAERIQEIPYLVWVCLSAGSHQVLAEVVAADAAAFQATLSDLSNLPEVVEIESYVLLEELKLPTLRPAAAASN